MIKLTFKKSLAAALFITAPMIHAQTAPVQSQKVLWGFRCSTPETKTVTTVALQDNKVVSITVHPEIEGQINFARTASLHEIGQNRYSGDFKPVQATEDDESLSQHPLNYEMTFLLQDDTEKENPKIQEASLKENGIAPVNLNCLAVFQTKTKETLL